MGQQKQFYESAKGGRRHIGNEGAKGNLSRFSGKKHFYESAKGLYGPLEVSCRPL